MFNGAIVTRQDLEEAAKIQRRRQFEEDRKKRIFNTKQRIIGIDSSLLDGQLLEHREKESKELEIERRYNDETEKQNFILQSYDWQQQQQRRILENDMNLYRCNYQRKEQRREYDLNDPYALRKSKAMRQDDDTIKLGLSSAQIFDGEDLTFDERRRLQTEQQCAWLEQQIRERKQAELSYRQAEIERTLQIEERERCLKQIDETQQRIRLELCQNVNDYNKELAKEKHFLKEQAKREKMEDDLAEIYNMLSSDLLAEDPSIGKSSINPNKRLPYMYRGMTLQEKLKFQNDQLQFKRLQEERLRNEKTKEKAWDTYILECDRELKVKEHELQLLKKNVKKELLEYNRELGIKQQCENLMNINKNTNSISDEFFTQFNTTSR